MQLRDHNFRATIFNASVLQHCATKLKPGLLRRQKATFSSMQSRFGKMYSEDEPTMDARFTKFRSKDRSCLMDPIDPIHVMVRLLSIIYTIDIAMDYTGNVTKIILCELFVVSSLSLACRISESPTPPPTCTLAL